ncbi:MAG TPA: GYD domain-containing protein [Candidatus Nitrosopolaris sp.]|nr:GYD domain-containing protein [Candidatus Nitrosopolaris sp.]
MPHYIILFNFTEQGIRNIKDLEKRAQAFKSTVEKAGGKFVGDSFLYLTLGKYDTVSIVEAPNDEAILPAILATARLGNVRCETLKAFTMDEAAKIIERA